MTTSKLSRDPDHVSGASEFNKAAEKEHIWLQISCHVTLTMFQGLLNLIKQLRTYTYYLIITYDTKQTHITTNNTYCHSHDKWGVSYRFFQRFYSSKLVLKTVESCFVALNYYENGNIASDIRTHHHAHIPRQGEPGWSQAQALIKKCLWQLWLCHDAIRGWSSELTDVYKTSILRYIKKWYKEPWSESCGGAIRGWSSELTDVYKTSILRYIQEWFEEPLTREWLEELWRCHLWLRRWPGMHTTNIPRREMTWRAVVVPRVATRWPCKWRFDAWGERDGNQAKSQAKMDQRTVVVPSVARRWSNVHKTSIPRHEMTWGSFGGAKPKWIRKWLEELWLCRRWRGGDLKCGRPRGREGMCAHVTATRAHSRRRICGCSHVWLNVRDACTWDKQTLVSVHTTKIYSCVQSLPACRIKTHKHTHTQTHTTHVHMHINTKIHAHTLAYLHCNGTGVFIWSQNQYTHTHTHARTHARTHTHAYLHCNRTGVFI
jgi:hypothetical protein